MESDNVDNFLLNADKKKVVMISPYYEDTHESAQIIIKIALI